MKRHAFTGMAVLWTLVAAASAQFPGWQHCGSMYILTTPEGANLPAAAVADGFPLLVRLHQDFFDFRQAKPNGEDIRFATGTGEVLPYQIEQWDPAAGIASIWVRMGQIKGNARQELKLYWGKYDNHGARLQIGYWGIELAKLLVESEKIPICIINGAVGGTRIDQHQRNPADPEDASTIYGRLLWRVRQARLTHGIRGVLWHQGESDQGADGPTGRYGWETYGQYFLDLAAAWKEDYPNIQHYYLFQIWPRACAMGVGGSDNMLREVQRTLPSCFSHMSVMSTLGIKPPGGCHFPPAGYAEMARQICPLLQRDNYGKVFPQSITPANLLAARYTSGKKDEIVMLRFGYDTEGLCGPP